MTFTFVVPLILVLFLSLAACSSDDDDTPSVSPASSGPSTSGEGSGGGGKPPDNLVAVLKSLPVFPDARLVDGQLVDAEYPTGGSVGDNLLTGFYVSPGTITVDDVVSFFGKELPKVGWQEEEAPWIYGGEKEGSVVQTVIYTFLNADNGLRLTISIPLIHKDAPDGVTGVTLILAPKEIKMFGSPVATPIDSTPPPTPTFEPEVTPAIQPSGSDTSTNTTAAPVSTP